MMELLRRVNILYFTFKCKRSSFHSFVHSKLTVFGDHYTNTNILNLQVLNRLIISYDHYVVSTFAKIFK